MARGISIAIVTHNVVRGDGQGRVNYEIVRHGQSQGYRFQVVGDCLAPELSAWGATLHPVHPKAHRINLFKGWEFARRADPLLRRLRAAGEIDLVHANGYTTGVPHEVNTAHLVHHAWLRSPLHPSRQGTTVSRLYQGTYSRCNARWELPGYLRARAVVAPSHRVAEELRALGVAPDRLRVILNGSDPDEFVPDPVASRSALGLPEGVPLALFAGEIKTGRKNLDAVLAALRRIDGLHLAVVGGLDGSPYPERARRLGVEERVHFLGFRGDIARLMPAADVFVFPSRYEPFGLVVLEAMLCGLPVVVSAACGASDLVRPDCGVVLADAEDHDALAQALESVLADPVRRRAMGCRARAVAERCSWKAMAQQYLALYDECLEAAVPSV
jgi:glycosyltransferase involved in cell wall biosynthesis